MRLGLLSRPPRASASRLLIAERFVVPCAGLSTLVLPLDVIARQPLERLRLVLFAADRPEAHRSATLVRPRLSPDEALRLVFAPFEAPAGTSFVLGVLEPPESGADLRTDLLAIRDAAAGRSPIGLECGGGEEREGAADLIPDEQGIAVFRLTSRFASDSADDDSAAPFTSDRASDRASDPPADAAPAIRTAYWLDAFWCDSHGLYLRGWVHAHEHPVRALRVESSGRSARTETFADRPDLLVHYPEHEHVRHAGFAVYLACPPGHPVSLTVETDGGPASFPLPLPEGPLPPWPPESGDGAELSPMMSRFFELVNFQTSQAGRRGLLLQIGARTPRGMDAIPPRHLLQGRVIGVDIHPGHNVDVVGDAHGLSRFVRAGSVDAVLTASVLEHLQAPWLLAAEINRVLKPGGLVYHQVPGAWPAHAQPNDFWRFSAEGMRVLFGPDTGFEVLDAVDSGAAAILPTPEWRERFLDMPTVPAYAMAEILARKVAEIPPGAVTWPLGSLGAGSSETRARRYPVSGLRPAPPKGAS